MPKDYFCLKCDAGPYMDPGPCPVCGAMLESLEFSDDSSGNPRYNERQIKEADDYDTFDEDETYYGGSFDDEDEMYGVHVEE